MLHSVKKRTAALLLLLAAFGCKRETPAQQSPNATIEAPKHKVQQWLNAQPKSTGTVGRTAGSDMPKNTLQWGQALYSKTSGTHFIPAALLQEGKGNPYVRAGLVATEDAQGQISAGHYMVAVPKRTTMGDAAAQYYNLARLYQPQPKERPTAFNGAVLYYTTAGQPITSKVYSDGQVQQGAEAVLTAKPLPAGSDANKVPRNCDGPGNTGCIEWYLQTFVNGQLIDEEYLFTTCCDSGSGGGGGNGTTVNQPCSYECQEMGGHTNEISGTDLSTVTVTGSTSISGPDSTGKIRIGRMIKMDFYKLDFFWGFYARFSAYYQGVAYKNNANEADWKWEGLTHVPPSDSDGYHTEGEIPGCHRVQAIYNPMPIMFSGDRRFAYIGYNFNVKAYFKCPVDMEVHNYSDAKSNVQINANREN